jgi:hypothetical protein
MRKSVVGTATYIELPDNAVSDRIQATRGSLTALSPQRFIVAPRITSVSPVSVGGRTVSPAMSGLTLAVEGWNLDDTTAVTVETIAGGASLGSTPVRFSIVDARHLTVAIPATADGRSSLRVRNPAGFADFGESVAPTAAPVPEAQPAQRPCLYTPSYRGGPAPPCVRGPGPMLLPPAPAPPQSQPQAQPAAPRSPSPPPSPAPAPPPPQTTAPRPKPPQAAPPPRPTPSSDVAASGISDYWFADDTSCCNRLHGMRSLAQAAVSRACREKGGVANLDTARWSGGSYCSAERCNGRCSHKFRCRQLAEGTCRMPRR